MGLGEFVEERVYMRGVFAGELGSVYPNRNRTCGYAGDTNRLVRWWGGGDWISLTQLIGMWNWIFDQWICEWILMLSPVAST